MTSDSTPSRGESSVLDAVDASGIPASVALIGFNVAVYAAVRYAPEYLRLLGGGPVLIGLFGSTATLLAVCYPSLGAVLDRLDVQTAPVVGALASLGVVCWLFAPQIGSAGSVGSVVAVFAGLVLVTSWHAFDVDAAAATLVPHRLRERIPAVVRHARTPRYAALLVGLPFMVGLLAAISPARTAIQVVLGITAAVGLTATVLLAVLDDFDADVTTNERSNGEGIAAVVRAARPRSALDAARSLPRAARQSLVGDALVEFAVGMVSVFLVITVTSVLRIDVTLFGLRLRPDAFFGVVLFVETAVALAATGPLTRFARRVGREYVVAGTFFVAALFPIALVSAPADATVIALLFGAFGCYRAGLPTRRACVDAILEDDTIYDSGRYRTVRALLRVPSALVGGLLYAVSPTLAFGLATVVGTAGVREFLVGVTRPDAERTDAP